MTRVTALGAGAGTLFMLLFAFGGYEMYLMHGEIRQLQELAAASGSLSALIAEWIPVTPLIACHIGNEEWDGTGILEKRTDGEYYVLTAKHVITEGKRHA